ncbi:hypothetical protein [Kaistia algarum]|uniref:hypothetical protein n=1 Tax=Kaistia algarum TaxID=2083279 RepID=UPI00225A7FB3|nr:hypothetical protein [Kaistia algarum]MCX5513398.1 hypothetical protein [Kaistia algarum]
MAEYPRADVLDRLDHKLAELLVLTDAPELGELHRRLAAAADEVRRLHHPSDPPMVPDL